MLSKLLILLTLCSCASFAGAQERTINRLPEISKAADNTVEYSRNSTGFWAAAELSGGSSCRINNPNTGFGEFDVIGGYRFSDYLRIGAGFGVRNYGVFGSSIRYKDSNWSFPIYVDLRGGFMPTYYRSVVPYWSMDLGATVCDGFMMSPSLGIRVGRKRNAFLLAVSYTGQCMDIRKNVNKYISMMSLRLGYEF